MRRRVTALSLVALTAHLFFLPPTLEDIDSINFALGVREFDVANHQPHPPGYPVYIALGRVMAAGAGMAGATEPITRGLALLSVVSGALLVPILYALFSRLDPRRATVATVCSPLIWFTTVRPLSDMTGLTVALAAQGLLIAAIRREGEAASIRRLPGAPACLVAGAAIAGLAAGVRSQTAMLTAPLLFAALVWPGADLSWRHRAAALGAAAAAALLRAVPLVVASGGLGDYLVALGAQGGEDFRGVVMLWSSPHPRVALEAVLDTVVRPWGALVPGFIVAGLAAAGSLRAARRAPAMLVLLAIAFGPYVVFHLLFHETPTLRYALPLVPPTVFMSLYGVAGWHAAAPAAIGTAMVVLSLTWTLPALHAYARTGSPAFQVLDAALEADTMAAEGAARPVMAMHAVMRRVEEWRHAGHRRHVLRGSHGHEWLALVEHWRAEPASPVEFLADPRRTDLVLFDPHARQLVSSVRWTFPETPFVAGARPVGADLYAMVPPGWMLDRGWALTAEVGGITAASRLGPHIAPSLAWVRARSEPATLLLGGRNLNETSTVRLTVATDACEVDSWEIAPGSFTRVIAVPAGTLEGDGYRSLAISAAAADRAPAVPGVALEQFDLQPDGVPMVGFLDGWHEPEYQPVTARAWRWMSARGQVWVRPVGGDVTLTITGESPRRYFDRPPVVRVTAAGVELARLRLADDFAEQVHIPADLAERSHGIVSIESDLWFSPADRHASADRRRLALRIYGVEVR